MLPTQLTADRFSTYPPQAKRVATEQLGLLQRLPLAFVPLLLRELVAYDWKFPIERRDLDGQFQWLSSLTPGQFRTTMTPFAQLRLSSEIESTDWVNSPAAFSEQLTAHLWATHQIEAFRKAAVDYVAAWNQAAPANSLPTHRLAIAVIGRGVGASKYKLFRKLRVQGTYFTRIEHENGVGTLLAAVNRRATAHPAPYAHWYIDGGAPELTTAPDIATVTYAALSPARAALQSRMQKTYQAPVFDPEAFRSMLARITPRELGLDTGEDEVLGRFQLSLLTEGSGTQVFSTTFVQWAAREALRRAQPLTLMARFAPRQREKPMNELLAESQRKPDLDPEGSLVDADMGAWYTWLNQQRLTEPEKARFLVWFEDHSEAVAIGPGFEKNAQSDAPLQLAELARRHYLKRFL